MLNKKTLAFGLTLTLSSSLYAGTLTNHLKSLRADYQQQVGNQTGQTFTPTDTSLPVVKNDKIIVTLVVKNKAMAKVKADLIKKGMTDISEYKHLISGAFPINRLNELENVKNVSSISSSKAMTKAFSNGGIAQNSADAAMFSDLVKKRYNVDGSGITIGVMSDSYDCVKEIPKTTTTETTVTTTTEIANVTTAANDVATGDLPNNVQVLREYPFCSDGTAHDEGRAMMQLIHDIAPKAKLLFYTAWESEAAMAKGILELKKAGAKIIVDDIGYHAELMFQDGVVAQAIDEVTAAGVTYFSAAGNSGRMSYETPPQKTAVFNSNKKSGDSAYDFAKTADSTKESDFYQPIFIPKGTTAKFILQWDEPSEIAGGAVAKNDLDMFLLTSDKQRIAVSSQDSNVGHDAVEYMEITIPKEDPKDYKLETNFYLYISHRAGAAPKHLKYVVIENSSRIRPDAAIPVSVTSVEYPKPNGTTETVGAFKTPDGNLNLIELSNTKTGDKNDGYPNGKAVVPVQSDSVDAINGYKLVELDYIRGTYTKCDNLGCSLFTKIDSDGNTTIEELTNYNPLDKADTNSSFSATTASGTLVSRYGIFLKLNDGQKIRIGTDEHPVFYVKPEKIPDLTPDGVFLLKTATTEIQNYITQSSTIYGHSNAAGAISVGAMSYQETPWFNTNNGTIENFSSAGGTPIFFDKKGKRLTTAEYRPKPEIIAADNVDTTFFPAGDLNTTDSDLNGLPNFRGTSAAAPNAAAVAALLLQNNPTIAPDSIKKSMMKTTAPDFLSDGIENSIATDPDTSNFNPLCSAAFDWSVGCGFLRADLFFEEVMSNSSAGVLLSLDANKTSVKAGETVDYEFRVSNQTKTTLSNVKIVSSKIPQNVTLDKENVSGCEAVTVTPSSFSCSVGTLAPKASAVVKVSVATQNNPNKFFVFVADVTAKERFDKTNAHAQLDIPLEILAADLNEDGCVDTSDYGILFGAFRVGGYNEKYDLNADKKLSLDDLKIMKEKYSFPDGASCSVANL